MLLGCIGDDFTGSSDLANTLAKQGMRVTQYVGVPDGNAAVEVEAGVVSLKSRTIPPADAVAQSLAALDWLVAQGCEQFFFKYCSTFDSTPEGNIGPVVDALIDRLGDGPVIVCPAFPKTGRSIYQGHLFVGDVLLSESGMRDHPLTPMTDADIRRWLRPQSRHGVGHVPMTMVLEGAAAIRAQLDAEAAGGRPLVVVDAIADGDLFAIGHAADGLKLVTGGSGVALGLPDNFRRRGALAGAVSTWTGSPGRVAIISGSCSIATRGQVARHSAAHPSLRVDVDDVVAGGVDAQTVVDWILQQDGLPLVYSSADPEVVRAAQAKHGREKAAAAIEGLFAETARRLVAVGIERLIAAGGETSGAVVEALDLDALDIGPEIDPGVPALAAGQLRLALKSGNFGAEDFFDRAAKVLGTS